MRPPKPQVVHARESAVGLPFREIVRGEQRPWAGLRGRSVAVDGYNALYQFLATIRQADGQLFTDDHGQVTSHLVGLLYRTTALLAEGIRPVWVFDGRPPELKAGTLRQRFQAKERAEAQWKEALAAGDLATARRKAGATSRLTRPMVAEAERLLGALGVPTIEAPSEGEAQAAALAARGQVWATASEDYDSLLFGTPRLVRGLTARTPKGAAPTALVIDREQVLASLGLSGEELLLVALLVGTDFNDGAAGYGPKKALKLAQRHLGWDATLRAAGVEPADVEAAARIFREPQVVAVPDPVSRPVEPDGVIHLLVDEHGFAPDRVRAAVERARKTPIETGPPVPGRQTALERFAGEAT